MMVFKKVENKNRYRSAVSHYWYLKIGKSDYLFSESQMITAAARAEKNPEDIPKTSFTLNEWGFFAFGLICGIIFSGGVFLAYLG
jgi:hypothetical protein